MVRLIMLEVVSKNREGPASAPGLSLLTRFFVQSLDLTPLFLDFRQKVGGGGGGLLLFPRRRRSRLFADVGVLLRVRLLAERRPEVVHRVPPGHRHRAFFFQPPRRRVHLQPERELHLAHPAHAPRDVGIFAVERDRCIESADLLQPVPPQDEVPALHHRPGAQHPPVDDVHQERDHVEHPHAQALAVRHVVVDKRPAQPHQLGVRREFVQHPLHPARRQPRVRIDVRDQLARTRRKARLPRKRQPLLRLVHHANARIPERNLARALGAAVVNHHDFNRIAQVPRLRQNRLQTRRQVSLLVVRRNRKAKPHTVTLGSAYYRTETIPVRNLKQYPRTSQRRCNGSLRPEHTVNSTVTPVTCLSRYRFIMDARLRPWQPTQFPFPSMFPTSTESCSRSISLTRRRLPSSARSRWPGSTTPRCGWFTSWPIPPAPAWPTSFPELWPSWSPTSNPIWTRCSS